MRSRATGRIPTAGSSGRSPSASSGTGHLWCCTTCRAGRCAISTRSSTALSPRVAGCGRTSRRRACRSGRGLSSCRSSRMYHLIREWRRSRAPPLPPGAAIGWRRTSWLSLQPCREVTHGLGVNLRLVPLEQHVEVRRARRPWLTGAPAGALEEVRSRGQGVGHTPDEIALPVVVEVDGVFDIGRRHELSLTNFAGPGAAHFVREHVAALDDAQRFQELGLKQFGSPAVVGKARERPNWRQTSQVGAKVGFKAPDGDDDRTWDAKLLLDPTQDRPISLQHIAALFQPIRRDCAARELFEALLKNALLAIARDDFGIVVQSRQCRSKGLLGNALACRLSREAVKPGREAGRILTTGCKDRGGP